MSVGISPKMYMEVDTENVYISYFYLYKYFYIEQGWAVT